MLQKLPSSQDCSLDPTKCGLHLNFENSFVRSLPGLPGEAVSRPIQTPGVFYARAKMTPVSDPKLIVWSDDAANLLDLPNDRAIRAIPSCEQKVAQIFAGNRLLEGMEPIATRYGGHQFGHWAGQLGDGRAILLGEILNSKKERWEIQLKGAGRTAYSRHADGRAVLRSSLREYVCSEAMFYLRVPTTRALCCVTTGDLVMRDMFYDGHPEEEPGAITTRLAPTFLRLGHFEILAAMQEVENLKHLVRYAISLHFPEVGFESGQMLTTDIVATWFRIVCERTAKLMVEWLRVGFVHGVMNTDNLSILGLTIDYGPYGWQDIYDPNWTPNTTDFERRRYRFGQQPAIGLWNLTRFAEALGTITVDTVELEAGLNHYQEVLRQEYRSMRMAKLGLTGWDEVEDGSLMQSLDEALISTEIDMTVFYRNLPRVLKEQVNIRDILKEALYDQTLVLSADHMLMIWVDAYKKRVERETRSLDVMESAMNQVNPMFVPRNYLVQQALDELQNGSRDILDGLLIAMKTPYDDVPATRRFFGRRPEWARTRPGCAALSCSS